MTDSSTETDRIRALDDELIRLALDGWTGDFRIADQAVLSRSRNGPFWLHLILLFVTAGIWFIVAVPLALFSAPERCRVWVDAGGRVLQREARADLRERPVVNGPATDGTGTNGTQTDGPAANGTAANGTAANGTAANG